jgi:hypothetical protein
MTPYADRSWPERLEVMNTCERSGSHFEGRTQSGFRVAIGRGKYAETVAALAALGFACADLYTFPLGADKPAEHLRHDSHGVPSCCWLFAHFNLKNEA